MKRILALIFTVILIVSAVAPAAALPFDGDSDDDPDIIRYGAQNNPSFALTYANDSYSDLHTWANSSDARSIESVDNSTRVAVVAAPEWQVMDTGPIERLLDGGAAAINPNPIHDDSWVESVGFNYELSIDPVETLDNESSYSPPKKLGGLSTYDVPTDGIAFSGDANRTTMQESRAAIGADNVTATGSGYSRPLAIIDTGANTASGQIFGNGTQGSTTRILDTSKNTITNETVASNGTSAIADGSDSLHGTWTAAAAAANASNDVHDGVSPRASLLIMKALGDDGSGSTADIVEAIRYSAQQNASVISMSLGSAVDSDAFTDAVDYAESKDTIVVAAAGNSRQTRSPGLSSPADIPSVIAVGAVTGDEPENAESAYFSQYSGRQADGGGLDNEEVDIAAPGMNTTARVATEGGALGNSTLSGTSMSTPKVSAVAYLTRAQNTGLGVDETRERVTSATRAVPSAGTTEVGNGAIAADYAIDGTAGDDQEAARTDGAATRDEAYDNLDGGRGIDFLAGLASSATAALGA